MLTFPFLFFVAILTVVAANNSTYSNIFCSNNEECIVECSSYRSCASINCNNSTQCHIICSTSESCYSTTIYHTSFNKIVKIDCLYEDSCNYMQLKNEPNNTTISNILNKSLIINSVSDSASSSILISDIATFSDLNVYCQSYLSCYGMGIEINHVNFSVQNTTELNLNVNIHCTGIQSCKFMRLYVSDSWQNIPFTNFEWDSFVISVYCTNTQSCQYLSIDTAKLKINSLSSTLSFADVYLFCANANEACLYVNIICPDLIPFQANYDYLYQEPKCHINMLNNSYENHISIISKHGMKMIDLQCDYNDHLICDGITLYCSDDPNSYFCRMKYTNNNNYSRWYCDNFDIFYVFNENYNYSYGCDEYLWFDDIAIIYTSKIPRAQNANDSTDILYADMSCSKYNPNLSLNECYIYCDAENSCQNHIRCDNSSVCHVECIGVNSCKDERDTVFKIYCPPSFITESKCSIIINPPLFPSMYGGFYNNFFVYVYNGTMIDLSISHNLLAYIWDYGMKYATFEILNSDSLVNWTDKYDVESWWRIININNNATAPLFIDIICDRCYTDWLEVVGYETNRNVSVNLYCNECAGTEFNFWGITSFEFDCYKNCSYSSIQFTDSNVNLNCYDAYSCNGIDFITNHANYSDYIDRKYIYNLNLLNVSLGINLYGLYGFNQLTMNCFHQFCDFQSMDVNFYCGAPDYFNEYHSYDAINESNCLQFNPIYNSSVVSLYQYEYYSKTIHSDIIYCKAYQSCRAATIYCTGHNCVIHCDGVYGCIYIKVYVNYYIANSTIKHKQNSLTIYCNDYKTCYGMSIYGNDIDYIEINCMAGDSCDRSKIYYANALAPTRGLNLTCFDITKIHNVLPADDIYYWPSCKRLTIYCPFDSKKCHINLVNSLYVNPHDINIYYAKGFAELDLNCFYNPLNNQSTCHDVKYYCSLGDAQNPYNNSNYKYMSTFNANTSQCIGDCCYFIFSHSPTCAPTLSPTLSPSQTPSYSPTLSPTAAPTRHPTTFQFNAYFIAKFYIIFNDGYELIITEPTDNILSDIKNVLEYSFLAASSSWSYSEYLINISNFTNENNQFNFTMQMFSKSSVISHYVDYTENNKEFDKTVSDNLEFIWNVSNVTFGLYADSVTVYKANENIINDIGLENYDYGTIVFICFTTLVCIIGILSFIHTKNKLKCLNKCLGIKECDDEHYLTIIKYAMQILDLYSDVAFSWELFEFSQQLTNKTDTILITVLYILSFTFCFIPWALNLIFAVNFERIVNANIFNEHKNKTDRLSIFTRNYFFKYSTLFAVFVIISGSVSATLQLINSHLFGHEIFIAGFSRYRLSKMGKFRIFFNVMLENITQFLIQLIYVIYFNGKQGQNVVTFTFTVSTCSSIISILSTIMAYFVQRSNKPKYQTQFTIEITLIDKRASAYDMHTFERDRTETVAKDASKSILHIDVIDINVKKLHKKSNLRKKIKTNMAKCIGRLPDNFELLYCIEQIDGLSLKGLCSSDDEKTLAKLFKIHEQESKNVIVKMYGLNKLKLSNSQLWNVQFVVFDDLDCTPNDVELTKIENKKTIKNDIEEIVEYWE